MQTATSDIRTDIVVKCPATGEVVGRVAVTSAAEVEAVAARLRAAQPAWQRLGVEGRAKWLGKWRDWLLDHSDQLHTLVQLEGGKSWGDTASEMLLGTQIVNYAIDLAVFGVSRISQINWPFGLVQSQYRAPVFMQLRICS